MFEYALIHLPCTVHSILQSEVKNNNILYILGIYKNILVHTGAYSHIPSFTSNQAVAVLQCRFVSAARLCKSFLLFLAHTGKEFSFNGLILCHAASFSLHWHRKDIKVSVKLYKATAFLSLQTLYKLDNCVFHTFCIWCVAKLLILRTGLESPSLKVPMSPSSWTS